MKEYLPNYMSMILPLSQIRACDVAVAGGKGANLGELIAHGLPVPHGFVICAQAYRDCFRSGMNSSLQSEIMAAHARLIGGEPCVVRSSATAEDLAAASFAGQHGTYYYVSADTLIDMVQRCWQSLWNVEAVSYRASHGIADESVAMAVVVQQMVPSDVSGVAFTVNPVSGISEVVIESCWGMGAALVDGRVTPDRYIINRNDHHIREQRIADKRFMVPSHLRDPGAHRLDDVPAALHTAGTLSLADVHAVADLALRCEQHFGKPQDIEWALSGGALYLLQSRPVTTVARPPVSKDVKGKWVLFKPLIENFTDPLTPLMADLLPRAFEPGLKVIGGRIYANLAYLRPFVPYQLTDEELAELSYSMFAPTPVKMRISLWRLPFALFAAVMAYVTMATVFMRTTDLPDDAMEYFRARCRRIEQDERLDVVSALRLLGMRAGLSDPIGRVPLLINLTCLRFAFWLSLLKALLRRWSPQLPGDVAALLCTGDPGVKSAQMGRWIERLAQVGREHSLESGEFAQELAAFLAVHGHRAVKEFEVQAPRWSEDPAPVVGMVRNHVFAAAEAPVRHGRKRADAEEGVAHAVFGWRRRLIQFVADRTRYYFKLRENSRFYHIMLIGAVRRKILFAEDDLLRRDVLKCRGDIFFLHWHEIADLQKGVIGWLDVEDRIRERRMEHVRLSKVTPPKTIGVALQARVVEHREGELAGQGASPGRYRGIARVIMDPTVDAVLQPGEVLIAPFTDPAWTPLFLTAGAAVVEVGSFLSHAGTVAREYGMPCVVDVPGCTSIIQTGMHVEVDGSSGLVYVISEAVA